MIDQLFLPLLLVFCLYSVVIIAVQFVAYGIFKRSAQLPKSRLKRTPQLTVIVHASNNHSTIKQCAEPLFILLKSGIVSQVCFIDNHSSDTTATILRKMAKDHKSDKAVLVTKRKKSSREAAVMQGLSKMKERNNKGYLLVLEGNQILQETTRMKDWLLHIKAQGTTQVRINTIISVNSLLSLYDTIRQIQSQHTMILQRLLPLAITDTLSPGMLVRYDQLNKRALQRRYTWHKVSTSGLVDDAPQLHTASMHQLGAFAMFERLKAYMHPTKKNESGTASINYRLIMSLGYIIHLVMRLIELFVIGYALFLAFTFTTTDPLSLLILIYILWSLSLIIDYSSASRRTKLQLATSLPSLALIHTFRFVRQILLPPRSIK